MNLGSAKSILDAGSKFTKWFPNFSTSVKNGVDFVKKIPALSNRYILSAIEETDFEQLWNFKKFPKKER